MGGSYREWEPRAELRGLVACVWERSQPLGAPTTTRVLPDGCTDLVFRSDGGLVVAGPDTGPALHEVPGGVTVVGLRFHPGAAGCGLGVPARELRDSRVPLDAVWDRAGAELTERLGDAPTTPARLALLQQTVAARLNGSQGPDPLVLEAIRRLGGPRVRVGAIVRDLALSERELRRRFQTAVGYGPKLLDRVLRFRRFVDNAQIEASTASPLPTNPGGVPSSGATPGSLAAWAAELGYADQAHFARAVRELSGLPPRQLLASWTTA